MRSAWVVAAVCLLASVARGDTPEQTFGAAFGAEIKQVRSTTATDDDLTLAAKIMAQVKDVTDPATRALYCGKAADVAACAVTGMPIIEEAMKSLAEIDPQNRADGEQVLGSACDTLCRRFRTSDDGHKANELLIRAALVAGDGLSGRGQFAAAARTFARAAEVASPLNCAWRHLAEEKAGMAKARSEIEARLLKHRDRLKVSPKDAVAARVLGLTHLTDLDDPAGAKAYLAGADAGATMTANAELACKAPGDLTDIECQTLGNWYMELAAKAEPLGKFNCLARARRYCERRLELLEPLDPKRDDTKAALERLTGELAQAQAALCGGWMNMFPFIDPAKNAVGPARWKYDNGCFSTGGGNQALLMANYEPPADYDLELSLSAENLTQPVGAIASLNGHPFSCQLGADGNTKVLIDDVNIDWRNRKTVDRAMVLRENRKYVLCLQVRKNSLRVILDGETIIAFTTDGRDLNSSARWALPNPRAVGFGSFRVPATFYSFYIREVSGAGKFVTRKEKEPPPSK